MTATWTDVADLGVSYNATADRGAVLQSALNGANNMFVISGPLGIARRGPGAMVNLTAAMKRIRFVGPGRLIPLGSKSLAPDLLFDMQGFGNTLIDAFFWNSNDCGQPPNIVGGPESPMDALWVRGVDNRVIGGRAIHFYTGLRHWYAEGAVIEDFTATVKDKGQDINAGMSWANDGFVNSGTKRGRLIRPVVAVSTGASVVQPVIDQPTLSGNHHRCGITADGWQGAGNADLIIDAPIVGDGFTDEIHTEGTQTVEIRSPTVGFGRRNSMTLAAAGTKVFGGRGKGVFLSDPNPVPEVNGYLVVGDGVRVDGFTAKCDKPLADGVRFIQGDGNENVTLRIKFEGDFATLFTGLLHSADIDCSLKGSAARLATLDRLGAGPTQVTVRGRYDAIQADDALIAAFGSGLIPKMNDVLVLLGDNYAKELPANATAFKAYGDNTGALPELRPTFRGVELKWANPLAAKTMVGATLVTAGFTPGGLRGEISGCSWPSSTFAAGALRNVALGTWTVTGNTSNTIV